MVRQRISPSAGAGIGASTTSKSPIVGAPVGLRLSRTLRFTSATKRPPFERGLARATGGLSVLLELEAGDLAAVHLVRPVGEAQRPRGGPHGGPGGGPG